MLLADSGPEIAAAITGWFRRLKHVLAFAQSARALVCSVYDWSVIGKQLYGMHAELVESRRPPSVLQKVS